MYTNINFKTKKAFKEAVASGVPVSLYSPGLGTPKVNGIDFAEGPWYPESHKWWAEVTMKDGIVIKVK